MKRILCLLCLFLCTLGGCALSRPAAYDPAAFSCLLSVDSVSTGETGRFTAACVCENGRCTLTMTAPERLADVMFVFSGGDCVMTAGGTEIPLSRSVSASLGRLTALLTRPPEEACACRTEGDTTVLVFPEGELVLDSGGLPSRLRTVCGRQAQVFPAEPP